MTATVAIWHRRWWDMRELSTSEDKEHWKNAVWGAIGLIETLLYCKGVNPDAFGGVGGSCRALALDMGCSLPPDANEAFQARNDIIHGLTPPTKQQAIRWCEALLGVFTALYDEGEDGEFPDPESLAVLKRRVKAGDDTRYLKATTTKWSVYRIAHPVGSVVRGRVVGIQGYGAFVLLAPRVRGLVHVSELAYSPVEHPAQRLREGQEVEARILDYVEGANSVNLSIRQASRDPQLSLDPWKSLDTRFKVGQIAKGVVQRVLKKGDVLVVLEEGVVGLVPADQVCVAGRAQCSRDIRSEGDSVPVVVLDIDYAERTLRLSIRLGIWRRFRFQHSIGSVVTGDVCALGYGSVVAIAFGEGIVGTLAAEEMSHWRVRPNHAASYRLGDRVESVIIALDDTPREGALRLSARALGGDPTKEFPEGREITCRLLSVREGEWAEVGDDLVANARIRWDELIDPPAPGPIGRPVRACVSYYSEAERCLWLSERRAVGLGRYVPPPPPPTAAELADRERSRVERIKRDQEDDWTVAKEHAWELFVWGLAFGAGAVVVAVACGSMSAPTWQAAIQNATTYATVTGVIAIIGAAFIASVEVYCRYRKLDRAACHAVGALVLAAYSISTYIYGSAAAPMFQAAATGVGRWGHEHGFHWWWYSAPDGAAAVLWLLVGWILPLFAVLNATFVGTVLSISGELCDHGLLGLTPIPIAGGVLGILVEAAVLVAAAWGVFDLFNSPSSYSHRSSRDP